MKLVIPSAKIVPEELQMLGKLPAVIYPVGQEIVFDHLLEQYESDVENVEIVCYEMADEVEKRLASYLSARMRLIRLPALGDLGNTIYHGLEDAHTPVVVNFADTIVFDKILDIEGDCFFYAEDYPSETWTFFEEKEGVIEAVYDKNNILKERKRKKLFVGVFKIMDQAEFKAALGEAFLQEKRGMDSFYFALMLYSRKYPVKAAYTENWFDIGHADKYYNSELEVKARKFNHITIDRNRGILRKTSDNKEKFIGEILWYLKLPADVEYVHPRIFSYSISYQNPFVAMEYYSYHTVHELFLYGDLDYCQWFDIFNRIRFIYEDFSRYQMKAQGIRAALEDVYLKKTMQRLEKLRGDERFSAFFEKDIKVNGVEYLSLDKICEHLQKIIPEMLYDVDMFHIIHGDLCFANIMVDANLSFIKLIDPRGQFGEYDIYGDQRYELAKLFHSVDGKYDFIIKDLFHLRADPREASVDFEITDWKRDYDLYDVFLEVFKDQIGSDRKKIELIEALLFLSMIPLHSESVEHQYVMLGTGIQILDRVTSVRADKMERE